MGALRWTVCLCWLVVASGSSARRDTSDAARLLTRANGAGGSAESGSSKTQRSVIYRDDYAAHQPHGYKEHDPSYPFEMRPPFAPGPAGRSRPLNEVLDHYEYRPAAKYAPEYRYQRPQPYHGYDAPPPEPYSPPVYVPRGRLQPRPEAGPPADPFLDIHHRITAQFEPQHVPPPQPHYPPPPAEGHPVLLPAVYRAPPPPPPPPAAYHSPPPYAHEFPYSEHDEKEVKEHPVGRRPHAKALGDLNPAPFIAAIANAYQENEKNFGVNRQGRLEHPAEHARPEHPVFREHARPEHPVFREHPRPEHPVFREHPLLERVPQTLLHPGPARELPYQQLGPLYSLATAGSEVSAAVVQADAAATDGIDTAQEA